MRLRDLIIVVCLLGSTVVISIVAMLTGSEVYFLLPSRHASHVHPPPGHPATYIFLLGTVVGLYFLSARYSAIWLTAITAGAYLGLGVGIGAFEWTPGVCQYLLIASLTLTTIFVWSREELNSD